jgi:hypothetical protein
MMVLPRVFCSGELVARVAEVDVYLLTVEAWNDLVLVRTVGAMTEPAQKLVAADIARSAEWSQRQRPGSTEPPPRSAAERLAQSLAIALADDAGTEFRLLGRSSGGSYRSGDALYCQWTFTPSMAAAATSLTVRVVDAGGRAHTQVFRAATGS